MPSFSAGVGVKGHFGSLKGNVNFEAFDNQNKPTLVIFYAEWCGHCKRCMPEVEKLKQEIGSEKNKISWCKVFFHSCHIIMELQDKVA